MNKKHEKSPCCQGKIRRFGKRRRQCCICKKTWRVWRKKRGRKRRRYDPHLLYAYLDHRIGSLHNYAFGQHLKPTTLHARMRQTLKLFCATTNWPEIPEGPLVMLADAMQQKFKHETITIYFMLLRSIARNVATICPVYAGSGTETYDGWFKAFDILPIDARKRIVALVCDGVTGLVTLAHKNHWVLQRCHFHLKHRINNYVHSGPLTRSGTLGATLKEFIDTILYDADEDQVMCAAVELRMLKNTVHSEGLRAVLSGFLKHRRDYRSYIYYPYLHLPVTNNSVEMLIGMIRRFQRRTGGLSSKKSLRQWLEAFCKYRKTIICNGKKKSTELIQV